MYVVSTIVMSGYDAVATMQHIGRGVALEGNPLMESLIDQHAVIFFMVKMALTACGLMFCYAFSYFLTARIGIKLAVVIYALLSLYHGFIHIFE